MIVTICGSYRFKDWMWACYKKLSRDMHMVFLPAFEIPDMDMSSKRILHKAKIDESEAIYVVDIDGYIGENTKAEIDYAISKGKEVVRFSENKLGEKEYFYKSNLHQKKKTHLRVDE